MPGCQNWYAKKELLKGKKSGDQGSAYAHHDACTLTFHKYHSKIKIVDILLRTQVMLDPHDCFGKGIA